MTHMTILTTLGAERGHFACSDLTLNALWNRGSEILQTNSQDCLSIPALLYTSCDRKAARAALLTIFGTNSDELRYDLPLAAEQIESAWRHFLFTGDRSILTEIQPKIDSIIKTVTAKMDDEGLISGGFAGDSQLVSTALFSYALRFASRIARATGNPERGGEMEMLQTDVNDSMNDQLWNHSNEMYCECRLGDRSGIGSLIAAIAEVPDRYQLESLQKSISILSPWNTEVIAPETLNFVIKSMAKLGFYEEALGTIRRIWSDRLSEPSEMNFEPNSFLQSEIAGIKPIQPGFEEFAVKVQPAGLDSVEASVSTIRGPISISWTRNSESTDSAELCSPKGIRGHLTIPTEKDVISIHINERQVYEAGQPKGKSTVEGMDVAHRKLRFRTPGGTYKFEIVSSE